MADLNGPGRDPHQQRAHLERAMLVQQAEASGIAYRFLMRLLTLPVWLPVWVVVYLWKKRTRDRDINGFAQASMGRGVTDYHQIALEWVQARPDEYLYGEFDDAFPKLRETFKKIVQPAERG